MYMYIFIDVVYFKMVSVSLLHMKLFPFPFLWCSEVKFPMWRAGFLTPPVRNFRAPAQCSRIQFGHHPPGDSIRFHRLRAQSGKLHVYPPCSARRSVTSPGYYLYFLTYWKKLLGWPKSLFGFFHNSLWENWSEIFDQSSTY